MAKEKESSTDTPEAPKAAKRSRSRSASPADKQDKKAKQPDYVQDHVKRTGREDDSPMSTQR